MSEKRLQIGDLAPPVELHNIEGKLIKIEQFWSNGPTLLTFLRHFG